MIHWIAAVAIVGATVWTGEGPALENATVLIEGNRISAVGPEVEIPEDATRIDGRGAVVTPGLIEPHSRLGVEELGRNAPSAVEAVVGEADDPVRAGLSVADSYDPSSSAIPVARTGGLTSAVVTPEGGVISGQSIWVDLIERESIRSRSAALQASVLADGVTEGSRSRAFLRLREALEDARLYRANRGPYIARRLRDLSVSAVDLDALERALERELRVVIEVDRASDILTVLRIVREHRLDAVLLGAREGWKVAEEIARAGVPVILNPLENLPEDYDSLYSRADNAALLHSAGVEVAFSLRGDPRMARRLRQAAGNAVANGFPYAAAIAAITRVPAEIFGIVDAGVLRPGTLANVAIFDGDPLEVTTLPTRLFIRGQELPLRSRQDQLTERYR